MLGRAKLETRRNRLGFVSGILQLPFAMREVPQASSSPPIHVHVSETTPVHVHLQSPKKSATKKVKNKQVKVMRELGNFRASAKVKTKAPWIPPGRASARGLAYRWEGPTHSQEMTPAPATEPTRFPQSDLSTDEEDAHHGRISQYERKINSLMSEVGALKNEVELQQKEQLLERQTEQVEELAEVTKELAVTTRENSRLRRSLEKMRDEKEYSRLEAESLQEEKSVLLKKLVEVEIDGAAAAKEASILKDTMGRTWNKDKRLSRSDAALLSRQRDVLMQKLETFEGTNRSLRRLLRQHHGLETDVIRFSAQKEVLMKKLTNLEGDNTLLMNKLREKEEQLEMMALSLQSEKENLRVTSELSKALESTRAQLQGHLHSREAENSRLTVRIRSLENQVAQQQGEAEQLLEQLQELQRCCVKDKEALRRATQVHKKRAEDSEDTAGQLSAQLLDKETQLADTLSAAESWRGRHSQALKEKAQLEREVAHLNNQLTELRDQLHAIEDKTCAERQGLLEQLHRLTSDGGATKLENQRLRANLSALEEKLNVSHSETQKLKASLNQSKALVDSYKSQVNKVRMEADEYSLKLELSERQAEGARDELDREVVALQKQLKDRLAALEPLPRRLKHSELQLQEAEERAEAQERRSVEQKEALAGLRRKLEEQGDQLASIREKDAILLAENKRIKGIMEEQERKLEESGCKYRQLLQVIAKREETIHNIQLQLDQKSKECNVLSHKMQETLRDTTRQVQHSWDRAFSKEHSIQSKVLELESQLVHTKAELRQLQRNKEEMERRLQSKIQDMKDRLENSDSTNRSLQNYVQFLKSSYANVFGESALTSTLLHPPSLM